jgi:hypothetical protein
LHVHATEDIGEDDAHLVPGEVDADARVLAGGEGVVGVGAVGGQLSASDRYVEWDMGRKSRGRTRVGDLLEFGRTVVVEWRVFVQESFWPEALGLRPVLGVAELAGG